MVDPLLWPHLKKSLVTGNWSDSTVRGFALSAIVWDWKSSSWNVIELIQHSLLLSRASLHNFPGILATTRPEMSFWNSIGFSRHKDIFTATARRTPATSRRYCWLLIVLDLSTEKQRKLSKTNNTCFNWRWCWCIKKYGKKMRRAVAGGSSLCRSLPRRAVTSGQNQDKKDIDVNMASQSSLDDFKRFPYFFSWLCCREEVTD